MTRPHPLAMGVLVMMCATLVVACTPSDTTGVGHKEGQCAHCDDTLSAAVGPTLNSLSRAAAGTTFVTVTDSVGTSRSVTFGNGVRATTDPSRLPLHVASITKVSTARAVVRLAAEKQLALKSSARTYLAPTRRDAIALAPTVTIAQLLRHTSGISDAQIPPRTRQPEEPRVDDYLIASLSDTTSSSPGDFHYANSNYLLLGQLLEDVRHRPAVQVLTDPVAMTTHTFLETDTHVIAGDYLAPTPSRTEDDQLAVAWTAGGIVSTPADLAQFWQQSSRDPQLHPMFDTATTGSPISMQSWLRLRYALGVAAVELPCAQTLLGDLAQEHLFSGVDSHNNVVTIASSFPLDARTTTTLLSTIWCKRS